MDVEEKEISTENVARRVVMHTGMGVEGRKEGQGGGGEREGGREVGRETGRQ